MNRGPVDSDSRSARRFQVWIGLSFLCSLAAFGGLRPLAILALVFSLVAFRGTRGEAGRVFRNAALFCLGLSALASVGLAFWVFDSQPYRVASQSMAPALQSGDRILVAKHHYRFHSVQIGDIVVYRPPDPIFDPRRPILIKRIVGLPGDRLNVEDERLFRNGRRVEQESMATLRYSMVPAEATGAASLSGETIVPEGMIYVFGDNSARSYDSRQCGGVPVENLRGKVVYRFWPPSRIGVVK